MARPPYEREDSWEASELQLADEDERLPWLDTEEEADDTGAGIATSRLLLLGLVSLVGVGALVALAWFALDATDDGPPADGSLIAAPEGPYKTKPEDEGGKVYAGTGDTSFAVGEGQTRQGQLADTPARSVETETDEEEKVAAPSLATTLNEAPRAAEPASGTLVQVGAFASRTEAQEAWSRLLRQTEVLNGVRHRIVEARVDIGTVHRLQAVTGGRDAARSLCARLQEDGLACFVK